MIPETFTVYKTEVHALRDCPCDACTAERRRITSQTPPGRISLTPQNAYQLGIIPRLSPFGSVAAEIKARQDAMKPSCTQFDGDI